ncbi:MAG TPA: exopolysaccharide biosynthesis protein [Beijerinckiaceae bacterium]
MLGLASSLRQDRVSLGEVVDRLGAEGLGLVLLVLTLPTLIPIPGPFGITFGTLIALVALQVMTGAQGLWLPQGLRRRTVPASALRRVVAQALPWLARAERFLCEGRLKALSGRRARIVLAFPLLLLAVVIVLPIPLGNVAPALALILFALGFMARDGAAVLVAIGLSVIALGWTAVLLIAGSAVLDGAMNLISS